MQRATTTRVWVALAIWWLPLVILWGSNLTDPKALESWAILWTFGIPEGLLMLLHIADPESGTEWFYHLGETWYYLATYWLIIITAHAQFARRGNWWLFGLPCLLIVVSFSGCLFGQSPAMWHRF